MRYTRYNYKPPRKNNNFIMVIILTLIMAIALGTIFSRLLPHNNSANAGVEDKSANLDLEKKSENSKGSTDSKDIKDSMDVSKTISEINVKDYVAIQCGVFSKKENALVLKNSLMEFGTPFIIEEDNLNRVVFGIYPRDSIDGIIKQLKDNKVEVVKTNFQLVGKDAASAQINEMISADIEILNKLSEKDTKAIQTVEFKKWISELGDAEEKNENYSSMTEIKSYLTALPVELKRENAEEEYIYIYKFIKKILKT